MSHLQQTPLTHSLQQLSVKLEEEISHAHSREMAVWPLLILLAVLEKMPSGVDEKNADKNDETQQLAIRLTNQTIQRYHSAERPLELCWASYFLTADPHAHSIQDLFSAINLLLNFEFGIAAYSSIKETEIDYTEADVQLFLTSLEQAFERVYKQFFSHKPSVIILRIFNGLSARHFGHFSIRKAMQHAWVVTARLSASHPVELPNKIQDLDSYVLALNRIIYQPGVFMGFVLKLF